MVNQWEQSHKPQGGGGKMGTASTSYANSISAIFGSTNTRNIIITNTSVISIMSTNTGNIGAIARYICTNTSSIIAWNSSAGCKVVVAKCRLRPPLTATNSCLPPQNSRRTRQLEGSFADDLQFVHLSVITVTITETCICLVLYFVFLTPWWCGWLWSSSGEAASHTSAGVQEKMDGTRGGGGERGLIIVVMMVMLIMIIIVIILD